MAAQPQGSPMEGVPGTPGIREVRPDSGSENFGFSSRDSNAGTRRVSLRAEIDTSPPFGSVKEAVTRFGGSGLWVPLYKFGEAYTGIEEFDIKKAEEEAAELEKDLIVKELETLDVLEELGTTKRIVEDLKRHLQNEASKCMTPDEHYMPSPAIKEMNKEHYQQIRIGSSNPCPLSSPDSILMELKQAKLNLGKTTNHLGVIQTFVESLNKKMKQEKSLLEITPERLTYKFAGVKVKPRIENNSKLQQFKKMVDPAKTEVSRSMPVPRNEQNRPYSKTVELRWIAAKKMEEAARAAEALALIEMNALTGMKGLSSNDNSSGFSLPEPEPSPRTLKVISAEEVSNRKVIHAVHKSAEANNSNLSILRKLEEAARAAEALALIEMNALTGMKGLSSNDNSSGFSLPEPEPSPRTLKVISAEEVSNRKVIHAVHKSAEANNSNLSILRKLEEASEEVKYCKQALEEALNRFEIANRKQLDAVEALRRWIPEEEDKKQVIYNATRINHFHSPQPHHQHQHQHQCIPRSPLHEPMKKQNLTMDNEPKPVLRPTVSMRDILSRKQHVTPEDCVVKRPNEGHIAERQMLNELREDLTFPQIHDHQKEHGDDQEQYLNQRRKFGFIHLSLPMAKQNKKKP